MMQSRVIKLVVATAIAVLAIGAVALASATFYPNGDDPTSSCPKKPAKNDICHPYGFVGKGDVQVPFGLNDKQIYNAVNASAISFDYSSTDTYTATCEWVTGEGTRGEKTHTITIPRHTSVKANAAYMNRVSGAKNLTGFNLTGVGGTVTEGTAPVVGEPCVGNEDGIAHNGTWVDVTLDSSSGGGLSVHYAGGYGGSAGDAQLTSG